MLQLLLGQFPVQFGSSGAGDAGTAGDGAQGGGDVERLDAANRRRDGRTTPTPTAADDGGFQLAEATAARAQSAANSSPARPTPGRGMTEEARQLTTDAAASGGFQIEPGVAFFLGGLLVLTLYVSFWAYRNYRLSITVRRFSPINAFGDQHASLLGNHLDGRQCVAGIGEASARTPTVAGSSTSGQEKAARGRRRQTASRPRGQCAAAPGRRLCR